MLSVLKSDSGNLLLWFAISRESKRTLTVAACSSPVIIALALIGICYWMNSVFVSTHHVGSLECVGLTLWWSLVVAEWLFTGFLSGAMLLAIEVADRIAQRKSEGPDDPQSIADVDKQRKAV